MTSWSQDFTVKSNARRAAKKQGIDAAKVSAFVKAGKTLFRFPMPDTNGLRRMGGEDKAKASTFGSTPAGDKTRAALKRIAKNKKVSDKAVARMKNVQAAKKTEAKKPAKAPKPSKITQQQHPDAGEAVRAAGARGAKFGQVVLLLRRPGGASMTEVVAATGWQPHSARARISVDVSKLLAVGEIIERRREDGVSHYAIVKSKQLALPMGEAA